MMKPCREEKTGLKQELNKLSLLLFTILLSQELNAQIPINGFCKLNSYQVKSGYTAIASLNFNNDSYTDLILFNKGTKNLSLIRGDASDNKVNELSVNSPVELNQFTSFFGKGWQSVKYGFTSRKNRQAGFINISPSGKMVTNKFMKFDSFPENISAADINNDDSPELLISGNGFNGLSILYEENGKLSEQKPDARKIFPEAIFIDLNNDGNKDIAAYDLLNNSINFYYNHGSYRFSLTRSFHSGTEVHNLKSTNINLDLYEDLIYTNGNSIVIMLGDAVSSYSEVITVKTKFIPDNFITGDFNHDGKIDIAYINKSNSLLSIIFEKGDLQFYDEIPYLKREGLQSIIPYYSKFIDGIAAITSDGELITVTNLRSLSGDLNIIPGIEPVSLNYFDYENNGIIDVSFIDRYDNKLKLITRNNYGIPDLYTDVSMNGFHEEIAVFNHNAFLKSFYCFSFNAKLIEIVKVDFKSLKKEKTSIYTPGNILDLRISRNEENEPRIYLAYEKQNQVAAGFYDFKEPRYSFTMFPGRFSDVYDLSIGAGSSVQLNYWQSDEDDIVLKSVELGQPSQNITPKMRIPFDYRVNIKSITDDILNDDKQSFFSFVETSNSVYTALKTGNNVYLKDYREIPQKMRIKDRKQLYFGEIKFQGLKKIVAYFPSEKSIKKIDFTRGGRSYIATEIIDAENINRYFIKNMNSKNYHLVYTNSSLGCITVKQLP